MIVDTEEKAEREQEADRLFAALAHSTRRDIVRRTMESDHSVSGLARCYTTSFAAIQKHVALLEAAGLVTKSPRGREQIVRASTERVEEARELLRQMEDLWRDRLDRFDQVLSTTTEGEKPCP
jgi:DNA-binding transcriptional ArsR family regulator